MQEMKVWSLGQEDALEKEMATHSSILAWEIPWIKETGGLQSKRVKKSWTQLNNYKDFYQGRDLKLLVVI